MNKWKIDKKSLGLGLLFLVVLLAADQLTKYLAWAYLRNGDAVTLIPGVFEFHYLQNQGAAFGMFQNMQWVFILFALIITVAAGAFYLWLPENRQFLPLRLVCIGLMAGGLGNMIDRILHSYVIDFLYFSLINFPIFNMADIYVCISTGAFLLLILFYYKEEDFDRIRGKKTKQEYVSDIIDKIQESRDKKQA